MDNICAVLKSLGIAPKLAENALDKLVFTEVKIVAEDKSTTTVNNLLDETSIPACIKVLEDADIAANVVSQVQSAIKLELLNEAECTSDAELSLILLLLNLKGLPQKISKGCLDVVQTETGADFPKYNPVFDFAKWIGAHPEHSIFAMPALEYVNNCYDDE